MIALTLKWLFALLLVVSAAVCWADVHQAHTHGQAKITAVYELGELVLALDSPAANFLGFEHPPESSHDKRALAQVSAALATPEGILSLTPSCTLTSSKLEMPFSSMPARNHENTEYQHRDNTHDKHHEVHNGLHPENASHSSGHQDIHVTYHWQCGEISQIQIQLTVFERYAGLAKIDAQWIGFGTQGVSILNQKHPILVLSP
ncbi:hypothetical protein TDB9533_03067 [Thalassocella blandensis]|nr:hypothetical protein TDB9533_03067 [Thalassocella blandensis]